MTSTRELVQQAKVGRGVLILGQRRNSCLVQFEDGVKHITNRYFVRKVA